MLSDRAEKTVGRALGLASERRHEEATVEHLLLALTEDADARALFEAVEADLERLRADLMACIDDEPSGPASPDAPGNARQGDDFNRTVERATLHVQSSVQAGERSGPQVEPRTSEEVTGADLLMALYSERPTKAVRILKDHDIKRVEIMSAFYFPAG